MLLALVLGFGLGLSLAVPPGPVNALIAREAARGGALAGWKAGLPAPIVDSAYLGLVVFGLGRVVDLETVRPWLAAAGGCLMLFLAWDTARLRAAPPALATSWATWGVTLSNPFQYAWWASAGAVFMTEQGTPGVVGFLVAIFLWVPVFALLVAHGARRWSWFPAAVTVGCADLLVAFALKLALGVL